MSEPIPIVICGRKAAIASTVRSELWPDYEVIHVVLSPEAGILDLPTILSGQDPKSLDANPGSQNFQHAPVAVALGGGYDAENLKQFQGACKDTKKVVWLSVDTTDTAMLSLMHNLPEYSKAVAARLKKALVKLDVGKEGGTTEGEYLY